MSRTPARIVIVGLGLIGGSLSAACRKKFPRTKIIGITRSARAIRIAKQKKWIDEGHTDLKSAFLRVGAGFPRPIYRSQGEETSPLPLVILCTPVNTLQGFLRQLDRLAPPGTVVTDTGSVKGFLVHWSDRNSWRRIHFVGAHPMAGSHERGIDVADPNLFRDSLTFVTPGRKASVLAKRMVIEFWRNISRRVVVISPQEHDALTAQMSHLTHLVAVLLVNHTPAKALRFAASGFRDTTRVAQAEPSLWVPILLGNRDELIRGLRGLEQKMKRAREILKRQDVRGLRQLLDAAHRRRIALR